MEAGAPQSIVDAAKELQCPTCARFSKISPARPSNPVRAKKLGEILAMDLSYHTTQDGRKLQILHMIDEASKFHIAKIIAPVKVQNYSDLGNCTFKQLYEALEEWFRYFQHPQKKTQRLRDLHFKTAS